MHNPYTTLQNVSAVSDNPMPFSRQRFRYEDVNNIAEGSSTTSRSVPSSMLAYLENNQDEDNHYIPY